MVDGITEKAAKGHKFTYTVEQPAQGSLKDHPGLLSLPGVKVTIVKYPWYGGKTQKPTRI